MSESRSEFIHQIDDLDLPNWISNPIKTGFGKRYRSFEEFVGLVVNDPDSLYEANPLAIKAYRETVSVIARRGYLYLANPKIIVSEDSDDGNI